MNRSVAAVLAALLASGCTAPADPTAASCQLRPGASVDVAIVTVIGAEYEAMLAHTDCHAAVRLPRGRTNTFAWRSARIERPNAPALRLIVALAGEAGTTSGALATLSTVKTWRPDTLILAGIAGGFDDKVDRGDVVVTSAVWGYDYGSIAAGFEPRRDWTFQPHGALTQSAIAYDGDWQANVRLEKPFGGAAPKRRSGVTASGNKVVETRDSAFVRTVLDNEPAIASVEMEAAGAFAAIELLAAEANAPAVMMLRGISDIPKPASGTLGEKKDRELWKSYAADTVAAFTTAYLRDAWTQAVDAVPQRALDDALLVTFNSTVCNALGRRLGVTASATRSGYGSTRLKTTGSSPDKRDLRASLACLAETADSGDQIRALLTKRPAHAVILVDEALGVGTIEPGDIVVGRQSWPYSRREAETAPRPMGALRHARALLAAGQALTALEPSTDAYAVHFGALASSETAPPWDDVGTIQVLQTANPRTRAIAPAAYDVAKALQTKATHPSALFLSIHGIARVAGRPERAGMAAAESAADFSVRLLEGYWPLQRRRP